MVTRSNKAAAPYARKEPEGLVDSNIFRNQSQKLSVSVVMAVFNGEKYINESVSSVLRQSYSNLEFIIVDDGSSDRTPTILRDLADSDDRISIMTNPTNVGLPVSLNIGLRHTQSEYITRMDVDDICHPDRLARQVAFMEVNTDLVACGTSALIIDGSGRVVSDRYLSRSRIQYSFFGLFASGILHPSAMIRGSVLRKNDIYYDESLSVSQDVDFFFRLQKLGEIAILPERLLKYREHPSAASSARREQQREFHSRLMEKRFSEHDALRCLADTDARFLIDILVNENKSISLSEVSRLLKIFSLIIDELQKRPISRLCKGRDRLEVAVYKLAKKIATRSHGRALRLLASALVLSKYARFIVDIIRSTSARMSSYSKW